MNAPAQKLTPQTPLERAVARSLNRKAKYYKTTGLPGLLKDLQHGWESGIVSHLIYTQDSVPFYKRHRREICALVSEQMKSTSADSPAQLFGAERWDTDDPFALDVVNQNLLAWFGFEETARVLAARAGIEI